MSAVTDLTRQGYCLGRVVSDKGDKTTSLNTNSNAQVASEVQSKETIQGTLFVTILRYEKP
jgi:hypothetical protein